MHAELARTDGRSRDTAGGSVRVAGRAGAMMHTVPEWDLECYAFAQHSGASV